MAAAKACSQIGSAFSKGSTSGDCSKWACESLPDTRDADADCTVMAQAAILKSIPYCTWWRNQVTSVCIWQQQPSAEWEKQFQSQCLESPALKSDSSANFRGIGWHRHHFLKFTNIIRQGMPMYDRQVKAVDPAAGFVYLVANISTFSLSSSFAGKTKSDRLVQGCIVTVLLCLVVAVSTALLHAVVLPLLLRSRFFARGSSASSSELVAPHQLLDHADARSIHPRSAENRAKYGYGGDSSNLSPPSLPLTLRDGGGEERGTERVSSLNSPSPSIRRAAARSCWIEGAAYHSSAAVC